MLRGTLLADLSSRLGASAVDASKANPAQQIDVQVSEFSAGRDGQVALDASWATVVGPDVLPHRTHHVAFTNGADVNQIVLTMSQLVALLSDDIAQTISPVKAPSKSSLKK
jgi:uncharacterized lipoprotein YmbA